MVGTLAYDQRLAQLDANEKPITIDHLDNDTVKAGAEVTIYSKKVPQDKIMWHGAGGKNRDSADASPMHCKLLADGTGTGTDGDVIEGELIAVISDSDGRALYTRTLGDLGTLAEYAAENPTERPLQYALAPYATPGRNVELRVNAASGSDGAKIADDSDVRLWRSEQGN